MEHPIQRTTTSSFRKLLKDENFTLNPLVIEGLGSVEGKRILHLQCNTGADSILLARMGATVTGRGSFT